ncbi:BlaI/MecI/CopY family transcriptional regulator [Feifania hominis]|uniref:BlaI/MecI/CopY family transcriptional regulator n=1 Tax=Feifania hominis TaxID=2763660 RepID=A0A926DCZ0_9FIRM|nr:BlaI/MecI/CopY family transcriptional regulator [Feifania hominis]MBC8535557.1 BlaI/MecI/CopY family transcriptional regulator [Feifania hominis]
MGIKLFDSELKVMEILWREGDTTAKQLSLKLGESVGWNKNTTYTVIKKCVEKGAIERREPDFLCHALITRQQAQQQEVDELIDKLFDGSAEGLFAALLSRRGVPQDVVQRLRDEVERASGGAV